MGWLGTIIGGGIGAMLGGPYGAIIGAALGATFSGGSARQAEQARIGATERNQLLFFTAAFSMVGKLAKADGRVCEDEIAAIRRIANEALGLDEQTRRYAIEVLNRSKTSPESFEDYARQFGELFAGQTDLCQLMLAFLFEVAMADGSLHPAEEQMLRQAQRHFRLPDSFYDQLYARFVGGGQPRDSLREAYRTLGVDPDADDATVKKTYRQKVAEFHPDRIQGKGLPPEFLKFANDKLTEINAAWELIRKSRGL